MALPVLLFAAAAGNARAELLLAENFDDISTLAGKGWVLDNRSVPVGESNWFQGNDFVFNANSGAPSSYIAANYLNAGFGGNVSNWLITPSLLVRSGAILSFYTRTDGSGFPGDVLTVMVAAGGSGIYTPLSPVIGTPTGSSYPGDWTNFQYNVGTAVPTEINIAFVYSVTDTLEYGNYIGIDDVSVNNVPAGVPEPGAWLTMGLALAGAARLRGVKRSFRKEVQ